MSARFYEDAFAYLASVFQKRLGANRAPRQGTPHRPVADAWRVDALEPRRLLAVHPAPELGSIAYTAPSYPVPSGAYWVSASATEKTLSTNSASPGELKYTLDNAPAGSTIILKEGTYRKQHSLTRRLTIQNEPGKRVYFKGSDVATGWTQVNSNLWYIPWSTKLTGNQPNTTDPNYPESIDFDQVYRGGIALNQTHDNPTTATVEGRANNAFGSGKFWIGTVGGQQRIYVANNPNTATMEISERNNNFNFGSGSSGSIVRGITFAHGGTNGMTISAPNITVENNLFAWNANFGLGAYGTNVTLRNNFFVSNGHNGVSGTFGETNNSGIVEGNYFAHNNAEAFSSSWNAAAFKMTRGKDLKIYNNIFEYNYTNGIWADVHSNNVQIVGNISRHNTNFGIFFESSHGATIAFNTAHNNNYAGILIADGSAAQVWNNTLVNNGKGIVVKDGKRFNNESLNDQDPGSPINFQPEELVNGSWEIVRDTVIKNNIVSGSSQYQMDFSEWVFGAEQDPDPATTTNVSTGAKKWTDADIPEGTSITLGNGTVIYNPRSLQHLGSRSLFYSGGGSTSFWTVRANALNSNVFHDNPAISGLSYGPVAWLNTTAGSSKVVYTPAQFSSNTDQNARYRDMGASLLLFNNAAGNDYRLNPNSVAAGWGEALPTAIRNAAADAGIVINDPAHPNAGSQPTAGALITNGGFGNGLTGWTPSGTVTTVSGGRTGAQLRITNNGGAKQTVGGLISGVTYALRGFLRVDSGQVNMGVRNYGGSQVQSSVTSTNWTFVEVTFVPTGTSAEIYVNSGDSGNSFADDLILVRLT